MRNERESPARIDGPDDQHVAAMIGRERRIVESNRVRPVPNSVPLHGRRHEVPIAGARSKRFEQFRGAIVVARIDPEEHGEPTLSGRDGISRNHVDFAPATLASVVPRLRPRPFPERERRVWSGSISSCAALRPP